MNFKKAKILGNISIKLNEIYHNHTGKEVETIENALERDRFLSGIEAKEFGMIDEVVNKRPIPEKNIDK